MTTFFNFQFPNQTINNNFPAQQQQFFINYYQQPFQQQPTYNQNNAAPDLYQYLQESNEFSGKSIAESSKSKYESNMRVYESVMEIFKRQPYPIDIDKMKVFFFTYVEVLHLVETNNLPQIENLNWKKNRFRVSF